MTFAKALFDGWGEQQKQGKTYIYYNRNMKEIARFNSFSAKIEATGYQHEFFHPFWSVTAQSDGRYVEPRMDTYICLPVHYHFGQTNKFLKQKGWTIKELVLREEDGCLGIKTHALYGKKVEAGKEDSKAKVRLGVSLYHNRTFTMFTSCDHEELEKFDSLLQLMF